MKVSPEGRTGAGSRTYPGSDAHTRASARPRSDQYTWPTESNSLAWSQDDRRTTEPPRGYYADEYESPPPEYPAQGVKWFRQPASYLAAAALAAALAGGGLAYSLASNSRDTVPPNTNTIAPLPPQQFSPPPAPVPAPPSPVAPSVEIPTPAPAPGGKPDINRSPGTQWGGGSVKVPSNGSRPAPAPPAGAARPGAPAPPVAPNPVPPLPPVAPPNAGQSVPPNGGAQAPGGGWGQLPPAGGGQAPAGGEEKQPPTGGEEKQTPAGGEEKQPPAGGGQAPGEGCFLGFCPDLGQKPPAGGQAPAPAPAPAEPAPAPKKPKKLGKAAPPEQAAPPEPAPAPQGPVDQAPAPEPAPVPRQLPQAPQQCDPLGVICQGR